MTVTFHLKKGVKSAYGNELTANDVYFKWERGFKMNGSSAFYASVMALPRHRERQGHRRLHHLVHLDRAQSRRSSRSWRSATAPSPTTRTQVAKNSNGDPFSDAGTAYIDKNSPSFGPYSVTEFTPGQAGSADGESQLLRG